MTLTIADGLALLVLSAISAALGGYFGAYLKRKGENVATHEDIQKLVDQVKATTAATESIRSEMSGKLWETQERWKAKRELYVDLIVSLRDTAAGWNGMWDAQGKFEQGIFADVKREAWMQKWGDQIANARGKIRDSYALANLVEPELADLLESMWRDLDRVDSSTGRDFLRAKAEVCDVTLEAIIKKGRSEFAPRGA